MAKTLVSVASLNAYLASGKDWKKDVRTLCKHLTETLADSRDPTWLKEISVDLVDTLLSSVLAKFEGQSHSERECICLIHLLCAKSFLTQSFKSGLSVRPMFMHEKLQSDRISNGENISEQWLSLLIDSEVKQHMDDPLRLCLGVRTIGSLVETGKLSSRSKKRIGDLCRDLLLNDSMLVRVAAPLSKTSPASLNQSSAPARLFSDMQRSFRRTSDATSSSSLQQQTGFDSKDQEDNLVAVCEAALSTLKKALPDAGPVVYEHVAVACGAFRGELSRLAMNFFLHATFYDVELVAREFSFRLPVSQGTIDLSDSFAARDFARIMLALTSSPTDKSFHALALLVRDDRPEVYLLACSLLSKLPWQWITTHMLPARIEEHKSERERRQNVSGTKLIPEIVYKLTQALGIKRSTTLLAACDSLATLGQARNEWIAEDPNVRSNTEDPFFPLSSKLTSLCLDNANPSLRLQSAIALAWIGKTKSGGLGSKLKSVNGIEKESWNIIEALIERCKRNPSVDNCECLLSVMWHYRTMIDADLAQRAFSTCLASTKRETQSKSRQDSENLYLRFALSFLDWANDSQTVDWECAILGLLSSEWPFDEATPLRAIRSVLTRIERSLRFSGSLLVHREAAQSMIKLGVACGEPVRIQCYACLQDFIRFSVIESFERDIDIRNDLVAPALQMFDQIYSFLSMKEREQAAYDAPDKMAILLCSGLPAGFSFLAQAQKTFVAVESSPEEDEEKRLSDDDGEKDENTESEESEDNSEDVPKTPPFPSSGKRHVPDIQNEQEEEDSDQEETYNF